MRRAVLLCFIAWAACLSAQANRHLRNSAISGTLHDANGEPLQGEVLFYNFAVHDGQYKPDMTCTTMASADGHFECARLPSGFYLLLARSFHDAGRTSERTLPLFALFPQVQDMTGPSDLLQVSQGEARSIDLAVSATPERSFTVLSSAPGRKTRSLQLNLVVEDTLVPLPTQLSPDPPTGNYNLPSLPDSPYVLIESWTENGVVHQAVGKTTAGMSRVRLTPVIPCQVSGTVELRGALGAIPADVFLTSAPGEIPNAYVTSVQKDGSIHFKDVDPGRYIVSFNSAQGIELQQLSVNGREVESGVLTVDDSSSGKAIALVGTYGKSEITGVLKLAGGEVQPALVILSKNKNWTQVMPVDASGKFSVSHLPVGEYELFGWSNVSEIPYQSPAFLRRYESKSLAVTVDPDARISDLTVEVLSPF